MLAVVRMGQRIVSVFFPSIELLGVLATVAVLAVGAGVLPSSQIGTLAAAYFLLSLAFQPLQSLSDVYSQPASSTRFARAAAGSRPASGS